MDRAYKKYLDNLLRITEDGNIEVVLEAKDNKNTTRALFSRTAAENLSIALRGAVKRLDTRKDEMK